MIFPLVLGSGKRLLGEGAHAKGLRLIEHEVTPVGTVIATYEPAGPVQTASFPSHPLGNGPKYDRSLRFRRRARATVVSIVPPDRGDKCPEPPDRPFILNCAPI